MVKRKLKVTVEVEYAGEDRDGGREYAVLVARGKCPTRKADQRSPFKADGVCGRIEINRTDTPRFGLRSGQVYSLGVKPSAQRRGVGTTLYTAAARFTCEHWRVPLVSDSGRSREADAFWKKQEAKGRAERVLLPEGRDAYRLKCPPPESLDGLRRKRRKRRHHI